MMHFYACAFLVLLRFSPSPCAAEQLVSNKNYQISIRLPDDWSDATAPDSELAKKLRGNNPTVQNRASSVWTILTAYKKTNRGEYAAGLHIHGSAARGDNLLKAAEGKLAAMSVLYPDLTLVKRATWVELSGKRAAFVDGRLTNTWSGQSYTARQQVWLVKGSKYSFFITADTRDDERGGSRKEIQQIVETIQLQ